MLFRAFGDTSISLLDVMTIQPIVTFVSLIPISLWGIGVRESTMVFLYGNSAAAPVILSVGFTYSIVGSLILPLICIPFTYSVIREFFAAKNAHGTDLIA